MFYLSTYMPQYEMGLLVQLSSWRHLSWMIEKCLSSWMTLLYAKEYINNGKQAVQLLCVCPTNLFIGLFIYGFIPRLSNEVNHCRGYSGSNEMRSIILVFFWKDWHPYRSDVLQVELRTQYVGDLQMKCKLWFMWWTNLPLPINTGTVMFM
jgi:hypothetical protein